MRTTTLTMGCVVLAALVGCVGAPDGVGEPLGTTLQAAKPADDNGTGLTTTLEVSAPVCVGGGTATVDFSGVLTTTGSVAHTDVTVAIDGGAPALIDVLTPGDFEHDGQEKHAAYSYDLTLENGTYSIVWCFTQPGSGGREPKQVCTEAVTVVVDCDDDTEADCQGESVFGDLVGNPVLCSGGGTPHVPVHLRGDFGEEVAIGIAGPDGFTLEGMMNHAGNSCIYQFNWDTQDGNNGGPGSYTFTFVGDNGNHYEFTRALSCTK